MWHHTERGYLHASNIAKLVLALIIVAWLSARCEAQLFYNFVDDESGDVLATLELTSLPATYEQIANLTFSPAGEAILGLGPTYTGSFDYSNAVIMDDGSNGLTQNPLCCQFFGGLFWGFLDEDPPPSTVLGQTTYLGAIFDMPTVPDGQPRDWIGVSVSTIGLVFLDDTPTGEWRLVPEPSTGLLIISAVLVGVGMRIRKNLRVSRGEVALIASKVFHQYR